MDDFTLKCFLAVASHGSFTKAANQLRRTQSAVTQQINNLEKMLSKKLFLRGKGIFLTKDGEVFLTYASKIDQLYLELLDRFQHPELEGEIRIGVPEDFATLFLSDILTSFSYIHPRIHLNVECDLTYNLYERFQKKQLDMVMVKMGRTQDFPDGVEIWNEPLVWVCKKDHLDTLIQKAPLPLVLSPNPCVYRQAALKALDEAKIKMRVAFSSPSYTGTIAAVKAGLGISVLRHSTVPSDLEVINTDKLPILNDIHVSLLKHTGQSRCLDTLEQFLIDKIKVRNQKEPLANR